VSHERNITFAGIFDELDKNEATGI